MGELLEGDDSPFFDKIEDIFGCAARLAVDYLDEFSTPSRGENYHASLFQIRHKEIYFSLARWIFGHSSKKRGAFEYNPFFFYHSLLQALEKSSIRIPPDHHLEILTTAYYFLKSSYSVRKRPFGGQRQRFEEYQDISGLDWFQNRLVGFNIRWFREIDVQMKLETDLYLLFSKFRNYTRFSHDIDSGDPSETIKKALNHRALESNPWALCQAAYEAHKCQFSEPIFGLNNGDDFTAADIYSKAFSVSRRSIRARVAVECLLFFLENEGATAWDFYKWWKSCKLEVNRDIWENRNRLSFLSRVVSQLSARQLSKARVSTIFLIVIREFFIELSIRYEDDDIDFDTELLRDENYNHEVDATHKSVLEAMEGLGRVVEKFGPIVLSKSDEATRWNASSATEAAELGRRLREFHPA